MDAMATASEFVNNGLARRTDRRAVVEGLNGRRTGRKEQRFFELPLSYSLMAAFLTPLCPVRADEGGLFYYGRWRLEAPSVPAVMREEGDGFCSSPPGSSGQTAPSLTEGRFLFGFIMTPQFSPQKLMVALA